MNDNRTGQEEEESRKDPVFESKLGLSDFKEMKKELLAIKRRLLEITDKARKNSQIEPPNVFWIPLYDEIGKEFPASIGRHMRGSRRFLTAMQMSAALNVFNRPILQMGDSEYITVTRRDYERAINLFFKEGAETIFTGIPGHVCEFFREVVVPLWDKCLASRKEGQAKIEGEGDEKPAGGTISQMEKNYRNVTNKSISGKTIYNRYLPHLENKGLVSHRKNPDDKRENLYTVQQREISPEKTPIYPFSEKGNIFSKDKLERELNSLREIFPLKLLSSSNEISVDQLWDVIITKGVLVRIMKNPEIGKLWPIAPMKNNPN